MAAGGIVGPALRALQETLVQEADDFGGRRGTITDSQTLKVVVGAGL